jgi:hypothetical protein
MIHILAFNALLLACLLFSLICGGGPEKAAMLSLVSAALLTIFAIHFLPSEARFTGSAGALAFIDVSLFIALVCLALRANRYWTIVLAGLQLATIFVHTSKAMFPALPNVSYGIFAQFWAWPMLLTAAVGIFCHRKRIRKYGAERDWKPFWPHSVRGISAM